MFNPFNLVSSLFPMDEEPVGLLSSMDFVEPEPTVKVTITKTTSVSLYINDGERSVRHEQTETETTNLELPASLVTVTTTDEDADEDEDGVWAFDMTFKKVPQLLRTLYGAVDALAEKHGLAYEVIADNDEIVTFRFSSPDYDAVETVAASFFMSPSDIYRHTA